jgi:hypothetical protein
MLCAHQFSTPSKIRLVAPHNNINSMEIFRIIRGESSVLILSPKPSFLELVSSVARRQSANLDDIYFPEEDGVLLIPPIGTFEDYSKFEAFVTRLKPDLMMREFGKFSIPQPAMDWTADAFDEFFSITIRDRVEIVEMNPSANP